MDFKDISSVLPDPVGKKQHVIETFNFVNAGTSILLDAQLQSDFHAQTALQAVIRFLQPTGSSAFLPKDPSCAIIARENYPLLPSYPSARPRLVETAWVIRRESHTIKPAIQQNIVRGESVDDIVTYIPDKSLRSRFHAS